MTSKIVEINIFLRITFFCGWVLLISSCGARNVSSVSNQPQCAHWAILRSCQLCGVPMSMPLLLDKLPPLPSGHSLLQISEVLQSEGLETEGRVESKSTFASLSFPLIAHLTHPNHFVVIAGIEDNAVHIYDGEGQRITKNIESFFEHWGGSVLLVKKPKEAKRSADSPKIQFDSLLLDLGTVPVTGEPVPFEFTFQNIGSQDLNIEAVIPDCSCIKSEQPERAIPPNGKETIKLYYNVQPHQGPFSHSVVVKSNDPKQSVLSLMASGWSGTELEIKPSNIYLPDLVSGQEKTIRCLIKYTGNGTDLNIKVGEVAVSHTILTGYKIEPLSDEKIRQFFPYIPRNDKRKSQLHLLELTLNVNGNADDDVNGTITLNTNIKDYERFVLQINGNINGIVKAHPNVLDFRECLSENGIVKHTVTLVNNSEDWLKIIDVESPSINTVIDYSKQPFRKNADIIFSLPEKETLLIDKSSVTIIVQLCSTNDVFPLPLKIIDSTISAVKPL